MRHIGLRRSITDKHCSCSHSQKTNQQHPSPCMLFVNIFALYFRLLAPLLESRSQKSTDKQMNEMNGVAGVFRVRMLRLSSSSLAATLLLLLLSTTTVSAQSITGIFLVNTETNEDIRRIENNEVIDLNDAGAGGGAVISGDRISLRASVAGSPSLVQFFVNGQRTSREREAPYSAGGDVGGNFKPLPQLVEPESSSVLFEVIAYQQDESGSDVEVDAEVLNLQIFGLDEDDNEPQQAPEATTTSGDSDVPSYRRCKRGCRTGVTQVWHKTTLGFVGPMTDEMATPNPFTDYRLDVEFTHGESGVTYLVPGYYAGDGNAANSGATGGNVWLVHFTPDQEGKWDWQVSFKTGPAVALSRNSVYINDSAGYFDGQTGTFTISASTKMGRDLRGKGRLQYVPGRHHLRFAGTGEYFLKAGADSPENFLAYEDFDNTPNNGGRRKSWSPHQRDYREGDPTWAGGKGSEIIGAINYLSAKGMNAFSFLTLNIEGDDENVFPYVSDKGGSDRLRMDNSKLEQWEVVFEHADRIGMFLHFKTQETENDKLLDNGKLGRERRLYYRELIARFGHHLALNWNIGEENRNSPQQRVEFAAYWKRIDPYNHPIVLHTFPALQEKIKVYTPLLGDPSYTGASLQSGRNFVFNDTLTWRQESAESGRTWVVTNDEQGGAGVGIVPDGATIDPEHDDAREHVLYGNIMAGGAGVEYYFGYRFNNSDLTCEDFRSRSGMWDQSRFALEFFERHNIRFWDMANANDKVSQGWCLADGAEETIVVYLGKDVQTATVDLNGQRDYTVEWYNPKTGGRLRTGSVSILKPGSQRPLGKSPTASDQDWVVLLRRRRSRNLRH